MLTDAVIRRAKPAAKKQKLADGHGLYLQIEPGGTRGWRWDYARAKKRNTLSFGPYPLVSIVRARELRDEARLALRDGHDPSALRRRARAAAGGDTFRVIAERWFQQRHADGAEKTKTKVRWFLDTILLPALGDQPIGRIEPSDILDAVRPLEQRGKRESAHRALQTCGQIFRFGIALGVAKRDMAADVRDALAPVRVRHYSTITEPAAVGNLLRAIEALSSSSAVGIAMRLAPLLFVRPGELRGAEWSEIDLDRALWRLPAGKMKLRRDHLVPLSTQAIALLRKRLKVTGPCRFVFATPRSTKRPLSNNALNAALRQLGYGPEQMTAHGFRAMARTLLDEQLRIPPDVIEVQLAHTVRGALGDAYNRAQYLEQRAKMMQAWADYLDTLGASRRRELSLSQTDRKGIEPIRGRPD